MSAVSSGAGMGARTDSRLVFRVSPMVQSLHLREQAGRCRRLARDSTDEDVRLSLFKLAEEYSAQAVVLEDAESLAGIAGPDA
jgi:hypothetical protein